MTALLQETLRALWAMALPVGLFSFALVWWSMSRGHLKGEGGVRGLTREIKAISTADKQRKKLKKQHDKASKRNLAELPELPQETRSRDPVYDKWMKFGGGFYGVVAFYTYLVVEWNEIVDFIAGFGGFWAMLQRISIGAAIEMLVNSIVNLVAAFVWPVYWLTHLPGRQPWLLLIAAYVGYWLGIRLAQEAVTRGWGANWLPLNLSRDDEE